MVSHCFDSTFDGGQLALISEASQKWSVSACLGVGRWEGLFSLKLFFQSAQIFQPLRQIKVQKLGHLCTVSAMDDFPGGPALVVRAWR